MDRGTFKCENCGADYTPPPTKPPPLLFQGDPGTAEPVPIPPAQALTDAPAGTPVAAPAPAAPEIPTPPPTPIPAAPTPAATPETAPDPAPEPAAEGPDPTDAVPQASAAPPGSADAPSASAVQPDGDPSLPGTDSPITRIDPLLAQPPTPPAGLTIQGIPKTFWVAVAILGSCLLLLTAAAVFSAGNDTPSDSNEIGLAPPPQQGTAVEAGGPGGTLDVPGQTVGER